MTTTTASPADSTRSSSARITYSRYDLRDLPDRWVLYLSPSDQPVTRLIVFVHGFGGKAVGTWLDFHKLDLGVRENAWWLGADLLFVGYESTRDSITAVANRIRSQLPRFYSTPYQPALELNGVPLREDVTTPYSELYVVGHSLGGVVLRRALCDSAQAWIDDGRPEQRPALLNAQARYFSPASAGFRAAGWLGLVNASSVWAAVEAFLRRSSAYTDLQPGSPVLQDLRERTTAYVFSDESGEMAALRARIVWANPDDVVIDQNYRTDFVSASWDGLSHQKVCKPKADTFPAPWQFVQNGKA